MQLNLNFLLVMVAISAASPSFGQYIEPEKKDKIDVYYPKVTFDSLQAKKILAKGTATIKGVAFTKAKNNMGFRSGAGMP